MKNRLYLYPLWLRIWHWLNALLFLIMIVTGASMHFANPDSSLIPFVTAYKIHNICGIILAALYIYYLVGNVISGNYKYYIPQLKGLLGRLYIQARFYLVDIFRGKPHPYHPNEKQKFNPLQQLTYLNTMLNIMPVLVISGLFLLFPELAPTEFLGFGGIWLMALLHYLAAIIVTAFLLGHLYLATTGSTIFADFKEMITGWHEPETTH